MDLPEISSLIGKLLTASDLANCIRVCRQWQFIFQPILYRDHVRFSRSGSTNQPSFEITSRHGHFMQSLQCFGEIGQDYLGIPNITHLTELSLSRGNDGPRFKATYWDAVVALVRRNTNLIRLRLLSGLWPPVSASDDVDQAGGGPSKAKTAPTRDHLWDAVVDHPNLKRLVIINMPWSWSQPYTVSFWHAISKLESLSIIYSSLSQKNSPRFIRLPEGLLPKLKVFMQIPSEKMQEESDLQEQLRFLVLCSKLEQLLWLACSDTTHRIFPTTEFLRAISERAWPNLLGLSMQNVHFKDQELVQILDGLYKGASFSSPLYPTRSWTAQGLEKLHLGGSGFGSGALQSLAAHFSTLTTFHLLGGKEKTSLVMQRVLESCPGLVNINGDLLHVSDIVRGKPWICGSSLHVFHIDIVLDMEEVTFQQECATVAMDISPGFKVPSTAQMFVYCRLAQLTQLEVLSLGSDNRPPKNSDNGSEQVLPRRLDLDLDHGLGELATLTRLKQLKFRHAQKMTARDVKWMGIHWKKLESITGEMNENLEKQSVIRPILERLKITRYKSC